VLIWLYVQNQNRDKTGPVSGIPVYCDQTSDRNTVSWYQYCCVWQPPDNGIIVSLLFSFVPVVVIKTHRKMWTSSTHGHYSCYFCFILLDSDQRPCPFSEGDAYRPRRLSSMPFLMRCVWNRFEYWLLSIRWLFLTFNICMYKYIVTFNNNAGHGQKFITKQSRGRGKS
jgi:hypothetical protein